ncbi:MAG: phosphopantothenoylcysteine decarboxylase [Kiritimatiellae bacterium]|nr:phosphopantothenoylcysteine decarboxylase [Kiritimatiellia bacterium]
MGNDKHVLLGVTGSIAAYKAAELVRMLKTRGLDVRVVMTRAATRFVGALTFQTLSQNPVAVDMFERPASWSPAHIALADEADVFLIAPCTANVLAKLALGLADDLLTATALATTAPLVIAPAMNEKMWDHPATREHVAKLKAWKANVLDVAEGELACGYAGRGRLAPLETIVKAVCEAADIGNP